MQQLHIERGLGIMRASVGNGEGTYDRSDARETRKAESGEIDLLVSLADGRVDLRQQFGKRPQTLGCGDARVLRRDNRTQVVFQGAVDGICNRKRNRARRGVCLRHTSENVGRDGSLVLPCLSNRREKKPEYKNGE